MKRTKAQKKGLTLLGAVLLLGVVAGFLGIPPLGSDCKNPKMVIFEGQKALECDVDHVDYYPGGERHETVREIKRIYPDDQRYCVYCISGSRFPSYFSYIPYKNMVSQKEETMSACFIAKRHERPDAIPPRAWDTIIATYPFDSIVSGFNAQELPSHHPGRRVRGIVMYSEGDRVSTADGKTYECHYERDGDGWVDVSQSPETTIPLTCNHDGDCDSWEDETCTDCVSGGGIPLAVLVMGVLIVGGGAYLLKK